MREMHRQSVAAKAALTALMIWGAAFAQTVQARPAQAQHLTWNLAGQQDATCLYGEITVLATAPHVYYCGANWHPGEPAGGYCGIQHNSGQEHRTIFSVWDTSPTLHPQVTAANARTVYERFGGEGTGGHTHLIWPWKLAETFQFFVQKAPGKTADSTDARYYIYDRAHEQWLHCATINSPNGGQRSVATIGGGLNSFLENFSGQQRQLPKLALYRLWLGRTPGSLKCLTRATGDGTWGQLHGAYFLAEGDATAVNDVFAQYRQTYGEPLLPDENGKLGPIPNVDLKPKLIAALQMLPVAKETAPR